MYLCSANETNFDHKSAHYHDVVQFEKFCTAEVDF